CVRTTGPSLDDRQVYVVNGGSDPFVQLIEFVEAQVIGATLHVGGGERDAERLAQHGNILEKNLLLQILRAGRDEDALSAQDRGDQIGERLARAGARFGQQHAAGGERPRDGVGHFGLSGARLEFGQRARQQAVRREHGGDRRYSGYSGNFRHNASTSV